ncbi:MAG: DUF7507 domain-containing protein [Candidatus Dojkabacteria bacterium]
MKLNKKLFGRSLYKIATILFLVGYNFAPAAFAIGDISKLEVKQDQSVSVTTEEASKVLNEVPLDTSEDILEKGISDPASIAEGEGISSKEAPPFREDVLPKAFLSSSGQYTVSSTSGIWTATDGGSNITGLNTNEVHWGKPAYTNNSGMRFDGTGTQSFNPNEKFKIGELTHLNWVLKSGAAGGATLKVTLNFSQPPLSPNPTFEYDFKIKETTNTTFLISCVGYGTDEQISNTPCDDVITFPNAYGQEVFTIGDIKYTLVVDGFQKTYPTGSPISKFVTEENKNNKAFLVGHLSSVLVEKPAISIVKKVNGEDANTAPGIYIGQGDPVAFEYVVQNTGNVILTNITVTDDKGVAVSCPQAVLEPGASMTCTSTGEYTAIEGPYTNIGTVVGNHATGTVTDNDPANYTGVKKVDICHATGSHGNPYADAKASMTADAGGHDGHNGPVWYPGITVTWGDIIPPFDYYGGHYPGKNWDAYGQSVLANGCTVPTGTLKVNKVTIPSTDTTSFNITGTGTPAASGAPTFHNGNTGTISHGNPHTYTVSPGTYSVSETVPTGWKELSNTCSNIVIEKGETKECTITNTKYGSITIVKDASPSSDYTFKFDTNIPGTPNFSLIDNSNDSNPSKVIENVVAGTYSVTENNASGWDLTSATCSDESPVTTINLSAGENVTCTFVNVKRGSISGHKYYDEDGILGTDDDKLNPLKDWTICIDSDGDGEIDKDKDSCTKTNTLGEYTFSKIKPGTYKVGEILEIGWINLTGLVQEVQVQAGEDKLLDFSNAKRPQITVIKKVVNEGNDGTKSASDFKITVNAENPTLSTFDGSEEGVTVMVDAGNYEVVEKEDTENYTADYSEGCKGTIKNNETKTCIIRNTGIDHKPSIVVTKEADKTSVDETGENVTFTFTVENTSKVDTVEILSLVDSEFGNLTGDDDCKVGTKLAPNATCTFTITKFIEGDSSGDSHYNKFTATVKDEEGNETSGEDNATVTFEDVAPTLDVTKTVDDDSIPETGQEVTFTFTVKNTSKESVTITSLSDDVFTTLTGSDDCKVGTVLPAEGSCSFTHTTTLTGDATGLAHKNTFTVTVEDNDGSTATDSDDETITFENVAPTLEVTKTVDDASIPETGQEVTFTFTVKNTSKESVTITSLSDDVFTTLTGSDDCKVGTVLPAGGSCSFTHTTTLTGDASGLAHKNTFTVTVEDNDGSTVTDSDDATVTFEDVAPTLDVTKTVDDDSIPETGQEVTFTFTVKNTSKESVTITSLSDSVFGVLTGSDSCKVGTSLAPDAECSFTLTKTISGDYGTDHVNVFTAVVKDNDNTTATASDDETITFENVAPTLDVTKTVDDDSIPETGQEVTFTFTVKNTSKESVTITSLSDDVFTTLTGSDDCKVGTVLPAGGSCSFTHTTTLTGDASGLAHKNTFTVTVEDNDGSTVTDSDDATVTFEDVAPTLDVTKTVDDDSIPETGQEVTFTFTVKNTSKESVTITSLSDDVFTTLTGSDDCKVGTVLPAEGSCSFTHTTTLTGDATGLAHKNTFTVTVEDNDGSTATDSDDETITFENVAPTLEVTKTVDDASIPETGQEVTFTFTVKNTSKESVTITSLSDDVFTTLTGSDDCKVGTVLPAGGSCSFTHTTTLTGDASGLAHKNTFTVTVEDNDGSTATDSDDETITFENVAPTLEVTKTVDDASIPETGQEVTFTFTVKNTSKESVTITSLSDDVFTTLTGSDDCKVGTVLPAGGSCSFTHTTTLTGDASGLAHKNTFTVTVEDNDGSTVTDSDDATVTFEDVAPTLDVTKTVDDDSIPETGQEVTFTFTVKNTSAESVTITSLSDDVFTTLTGSDDCKVGTVLPAGGSCSFTHTTTLTGDASGLAHKNTFTVTVEDNDGSTVTDSDDATVNFEDVEPSIEVLKTAGVTEIPETGGDVTFTYKVTNTGLEEVKITSLEDDKFGSLDGDDDCKVGTVLGAGKSCEFEATFTIPANTPGDQNAPTVHKNIFTATAKDNEDNPTTGEDDEEVKLTPVPSLKLVKEVVHKYNSDETITAADWTLYANGDGGFSYAGDTNEYMFVKAEVEYALSESDAHSGQFEASTWTCTGGKLTGSVLKLQAEDDVVCTITNTALPATVNVYKDVVDGNNDIYSDDIFTVKLGDKEGSIRDTEEPLVAVFEGLDAGTYKPEEVDIPDGYTSLGCKADKTTVGNGETLEFTCTNEVIDPILEIKKSNNAAVTGQKAGDIVEYTITVTAPKDEAEGTYVLNDVVVSDIAPAGFKYISGTWTAKKNGVDMVIPEPTYNGTDRAQWILGQMVEEDKIVLTYKTQISLGTDPGVYPDIAWVKGVSLSGTNVLGNVSTEADTPFVGTEVKVIEDDIVEGGEVLGASISLPNTGASTYLTLGALIMMILGLVSLLFKPFKKFKYALLASVVVFGMFLTVLPTKVSAGFLTVKIETPISLTNKATFNIDFTAQDVEERHITVECYKDAVKFASFDKVNAGACPVTVDASGTYKFFVKAIAGADEKQSNEVTVEVNLEKPSPIIDYSKAGNVLKFKTANDAKIVKVEIHRSDKPSYTANDTTKIHTMNVAPNTAYSWTDASAEPGKTYYYALRSLDAFGNVSTMVSDQVEKPAEEITTPASSTSGATVAGTKTTQEGEVKGDTDKEEPKEVEQVQDGKENPQPEKEGEEKEVELTPSYKKYWYIWVPAILLVLGVGYMYVKRSKEE